MSRLSPPAPVRFFLAVLYREPESWNRACERIEKTLGALGPSTPPAPFRFTDYYDREMGPGLLRFFSACGEPRSPGDLADFKCETDRIERDLAQSGRRTVNLDPGYVALEHVVLATGKPAQGRPYLDRGVYAYVALVHQGGTLSPLPWTYPDYREPETIAFLSGLREDLRRHLHRSPQGDTR